MELRIKSAISLQLGGTEIIARCHRVDFSVMEVMEKLSMSWEFFDNSPIFTVICTTEIRKCFPPKE